ncbi:MAG: phosphoribosylanthranilate isomerase [Leptolyngbyaceae bacterium]|nr:phosphoribosylanthranilate isomerase [Leptolyngbyaceae bacterium]
MIQNSVFDGTEMVDMRVKICGIRYPEQGRAIAQAGATDIGFICTSKSPRYVTPSEIRAVVDVLPRDAADVPTVDRVGVFVDASVGDIQQTVEVGGLTAVQLHGHESPEFCRQLRMVLPSVKLIKAFRVRSPETLAESRAFADDVDMFLLDAYHPHLMGGTGQTINWSVLTTFKSDRPWFLAGGLTPDNVVEAITLLHPGGIDLSSSLERSPADKDLHKVEALFQALRQLSPVNQT